MAEIRNILICGNYGATNIGDELILEGILKQVRSAFPDGKITVMASDVNRAKRLHAVDTVPLMPFGIRSFLKSVLTFSLIKTIRAIKKCDLFIFGGGGLFTDEIRRAPLLWTWQCYFAHRYKKPIFIYAQSFGPLSTHLGQHLAKKVCDWAKLISVRDQESQDLLYALGVNKKIHITGDPAFLLDPLEYITALPTQTVEKQIEEQKGEKFHEKKSFPVPPTETEKFFHKEKYVIVVLRPWIFGEEELIKKIDQLIKWIIKKYHFKVVLLPFQKIKDSDETLLKKFVQNKNILLLPYTDDFRQLFLIFQDAAVVIGMRLHSLILALLTTTPFLGIIYSQKVLSFLRTCDQLENSVKLNELISGEPVSSLKYIFENIVQSAPEISDQLAKKRAELKSSAGKNKILLTNLTKMA